MAKHYLDSDGLLYLWQKIKALFVSDISYDSSTGKIQKTKAGSTSDVVTLSDVATSGSYNDLSNKPTIPSYEAASATPSMDGTGAVGISAKYAREDHVHPSDTTKVPTTRTVNGKSLSSDISLTPSDVGAISSADKGAASGVCPLNASSKIDATYLPSYVDDVIESYARSGQTALSQNWLATESASGTVITPEAGKIYVLMADSGEYAANTQFRWGGSAYVKMADGGASSITNAEIDTVVAT